MRILGIDPGYDRLGIAILDKISNHPKEQVVYSECFQTSPELTFEARLKLIGEKVKGVAKEYQPNVLAIETLFMTKNQKTAIRVAEARGVIIYECEKAGLKIFEATPPQIKMATTGYGKASKEDIIKMVKMLVKIDNNKKSDDELDAIAIGLTASVYLGKPTYPHI